MRHGVKSIILALRHRGDGGKLIVMRLIDLEEYVTDLITWQQRVDNLLHEPKDQLDSLQGQETQRPHWEPRTKADIRPHVIGNNSHNYCNSQTPGFARLLLAIAVFSSSGSLDFF